MNDADKEAFDFECGLTQGCSDQFRLGFANGFKSALAHSDRKQSEPFGYFNNPDLDGGQDCAETDDGAIALYERSEPINQQLVEALEPLAAIDIQTIGHPIYHDDFIIFLRGKSKITAGDIRKAIAALTAAKGK